ncbi:MAG: permease-like cell division protein FtsX [Tenericutes bacterium]|nr:permease-like cell division protein FtsX [Mycoplasmatota bacterium]
MRIFRIIGRSIQNAGKSILRNFSLSMASITCSIITLILVSIGMLLSYNINNITKNIENELTIVIFMDKNITTDELNKTKEDLNNIDNVKHVTFKSKEEIKNNMANENDTFNKIISTWEEGENPLQDSFIIEVKDIKDINETATTIKNMEKVSLVKYGETTVNDLIKVFSAVKKITIGLVVGLILVTAFLINNTIKITIFSRKREIDIMRLVGTSNIVIKLPFFIEGFFIGFIGSLVPVLITIFGYSYAYNALNTVNLSNIMNILTLVSPGEVIYKVSLLLILIGTVIGAFSSVNAVRKYLTI